MDSLDRPPARYYDTFRSCWYFDYQFIIVSDRGHRRRVGLTLPVHRLYQRITIAIKDTRDEDAPMTDQIDPLFSVNPTSSSGLDRCTVKVPCTIGQVSGGHHTAVSTGYGACTVPGRTVLLEGF